MDKFTVYSYMGTSYRTYSIRKRGEKFGIWVQPAYHKAHWHGSLSYPKMFDSYAQAKNVFNELKEALA